MTAWKSGFAATAVAALVFACSSGSNSGGSVALTTNDFVSQYCSLVIPCCSTIHKMGDQNTCTSLYNALLGNEQYDATAGGKCLDEMHAYESDPSFCKLDNSKAPDCAHAFKQANTGSTQPGGACMQTSDCAASPDGDVSCASYFINNAETRICQVQADGKAGDMPCVGTRDGNTTSSFGSGTMTSPPPSKGFICDVANGLECSSMTQQCTVIPTTGQPCNPNDFEYACVKTAYCDFTSKTCKDRQPAGADCSTNSQICADMTYCDQTSRKCTAVIAQGQPCMTSMQCGTSASCTNGTCQGSSGDLGLSLICR